MNREYYRPVTSDEFNSFFEELGHWKPPSTKDTRPICATCGLRVHHSDVVEHADLHAEQAMRQYLDVP